MARKTPTKTDYQALTPLLKQAQRLGALDKAEGQRRYRMFPQVIESLGWYHRLGQLDGVAMGMVMSMYRAGFDCGELIAEEE